MAVHLVLIACLASPPHTCQEVALPQIVSDDVVSCNAKAREHSEQWQKEHTDYLVIGTKCAQNKAAGDGPPPANPN